MNETELKARTTPGASVANPDAVSPTVFVIDDDASVRKALARLLQTAGYRVEAFASAAEYQRRAPFAGLGCLVLDVRMPDMDGLQLQEALARGAGRLPVVFLTGHGDIPTSVKAMKRGAVDFLTKPVDERDLFQAIESAMAGQRETLVRRARFASLTPRECEVLAGIIAGRLNKEIAAKLGIAEKTVKVHRGRVMAKAGVLSVAELTRLCQESGIQPW